MNNQKDLEALEKLNKMDKAEVLKQMMNMNNRPILFNNNQPTVGDVKVIKSGPNNEPQIFITKKGK